jgi:aspartyl-tRNA(Asn)/glutamyl-tRNA(Gln) amidotransferase subunit C
LLSKKEVEHVAKLARLELSEEQKEKYAIQLSKILDHFKQLDEVNTENIEPMAHVLPIRNVMRQDRVELPFAKDEILKNAPSEEDGFFKVPKI